MYYILTSELENYKEDAILEGYSDYMERIECSFQDGLPLPVEDIETPILFQFYEFALRGTMTDHLNLKDIPGPVFSEKVKTIFVKNGFNNIQYFRLTLLDKFPLGKIEDDAKKAVEYTNYYIANIVGLVDCVSHEKSKLEYFYPPELRNQFEETTMDETNNPFAGENTNDIDIITKLVLDESKIDSTLKIFRLKDQPHLLVFDESVVNLIRKKNLSGFVFVPVSEYTDVIPDNDKKEEVRNEPEQKKTSVALKQKESSVQLKVKEEPKEPVQQEEPEEQKEPKRRKFFFD